MIQNPPIKSICILRLSAIGDVTHVLPVIATLQKTMPQAEITWIIGKLEHKLLQGLPGVNFIVFDKSHPRQAYKHIKQQFKDKMFDVLLQMQYSFRANRLAWKIPALKRVGFDKQRARELHGYKLTDRIAAVKNQHVLDSFMEFLKPLGIKEKILAWNIPVSAQDQQTVGKIIDKNKPNVILSPFSSAKHKNWSNVKYAQIIDYLVEHYHAHVILCGSPNPYEVQTAGEIAKMARYRVTDMTGKDTLKQLFALLQIVDLVISPDSGPLHMANAANTPVIGLYAATTAKRSGAYMYQNLSIDCFAQAALKYLHKPAEKIRWGSQIKHPNAMDLISVKQVTEKIDCVLGNM